MTFTIPITPIRAHPVYGLLKRDAMPWARRVRYLRYLKPRHNGYGISPHAKHRPPPAAKASVRGSSTLACPHCRRTQTAVLETQPNARRTAVHRRRVCVVCNYRFSTDETITKQQENK